jgi:hypothetical protein
MLRGIIGGGGGAGTPGADGRTVLTTAGIPSAGTGNNGDYAYDPAAQLMFGPKAGGVWPDGVSIKGTDGADGSAVSFKGWNITTGTPSTALGNVGEAAVDPTTGLAWIPKQASSTPTPDGFFGINTHIASTYAPTSGVPTPAQYVAKMQDLGCQIVRTNVSNTTAATTTLPYFQAFKAAGIKTMAVLDQGVPLGSSYATNKTNGQTYASGIATILAGYVDYYEMSNEIDFACRTDGGGGSARTTATNGVTGAKIGTGIDGSIPGDYSITSINALRGWITGGLIGIRAADPAAKCSYASGVPFAYVVLDMMVNGREPAPPASQTPTVTVASANPAIVMDFATSHWYSSMGNWVNAGPSTYLGTLQNVPAQMRSVSGNLPIHVTEWGMLGTDASQASYMTSQSNFWFTNRATYGIQAVMMYALYPNPGDGAAGSPNYGIIQLDGTTLKSAYTTLKNYHVANTTPGTTAWPGTPFQLPKQGDVPSACNIYSTAANITDIRNGTNNQTLRVWQTIDGGLANGSFGGMWYAGGQFHFGTDKIGTGSPPGTRYTVNGIDLLSFGAGSLSPVTDQAYNLGNTTTRYLRAYIWGLNMKIARTSTSGTTIANPSAPGATVWTGAGAGTITVEAAPEDGQFRIFTNSATAAVTFTVNYTGRGGASTVVLNQDQSCVLQFDGTGACWNKISVS